MNKVDKISDHPKVYENSLAVCVVSTESYGYIKDILKTDDAKNYAYVPTLNYDENGDWSISLKISRKNQ